MTRPMDEDQARQSWGISVYMPAGVDEIIKDSAGKPDMQTRLGELLLHSANFNDWGTIRRLLEEQHIPLNFADSRTGLTALHIAVGRDHLELAHSLVERGAAFLPDNQGRMPTTIAAECEVSDEMCDFIAEAEAKAEGV